MRVFLQTHNQGFLLSVEVEDEVEGRNCQVKSPTRVRDQNVKVARGNGREQYSDRSRVVDSPSRPTDDFSIQKETEKN